MPRLLICSVLIFPLLNFYSCAKKQPDDLMLSGLVHVTGKHSNHSDSFVAKVFVFFSPECPLSENYTLTVNKLHQKYGNDFQFYGIIPGNYFNKKDVKEFATKYEIKYPLLIDSEMQLVKHLGATITPEAFLVNNGIVKYSGAIDNWAFALGRKRRVITEHYLDDALLAVIENIEVPVRRTKAIGCIIE